MIYFGLDISYMHIVHISNNLHFIKIVDDLITLYDLSTNFTINPHT